MHLTRIALLPVLVLVLALAACGGDDEGEDAAPRTDQLTTVSPQSGACDPVEAPEPREDGALEAPTERLDPDTTYSLFVRTNCGTFTISLDQETAPNTAASLVALAREGFFDGTTFHRVVPGFVIQGGDPTGEGGGGPGYSTVDPPPDDAAYTQGVVAMAKAPGEPAGTAGSQFFVVTGPDAGLPPEYAVVGRVVRGIETVMTIDGLGSGDGPPSQPVVIQEVTVEES